MDRQGAAFSWRAILSPPVLNIWCLFVVLMSCFWWPNLLTAQEGVRLKIKVIHALPKFGLLGEAAHGG